MQVRIKKLQALIKSLNLDCLLVTELSQIRYLCGYTGSNGILAVFANEAHFVTDFRYKAQVGKEVKSAKIMIAQRDLYTELPKIKLIKRPESPYWVSRSIYVGQESGYAQSVAAERAVCADHLHCRSNGFGEGQ